MTDKTTRRMRIYQDEVKLRHTSHWDIDSMSRAELEAYMAGELDLPNAHVPPTDQASTNQVVTQACGTVRPSPPPTMWERFLRACLPAR